MNVLDSSDNDDSDNENDQLKQSEEFKGIEFSQSQEIKKSFFNSFVFLVYKF